MRKIWGAAGLAATALVLSACASSGSTNSSAAAGNTPAAANSSPASPASSGTTLAAKPIAGQQVLINAKGFTLYWFVPDTSTTSKCSGSCATFWPPVKGPATAMSGVTGKLSTITRSDGSTQVTYDGHPLYTYAGDTSPGQAKGNGINASGGVWHEMTVSGVTTAAGASTKASTGGGYGN